MNSILKIRNHPYVTLGFVVAMITLGICSVAVVRQVPWAQRFDPPFMMTAPALAGGIVAFVVRTFVAAVRTIQRRIRLS
jgi:hypothetical protein